MSDAQTTLGGMRSGQDPRVPGIFAELEQLRHIASSAQGYASRALGMVEGIAARLDSFEGELGKLRELLEQRYPHGEVVELEAQGAPGVEAIAEHVGELEGRMNVLAKVVVSSIPGALEQLRQAQAEREAAARGE